MSYAAFSHLTDPGRKRPALWRLVLGIVTIVALTFVWAFGVILLTGLILNADDPDAVMTLMMGGSNDPVGVLLALSLIAGLTLGTVIAARLWHKRSAGSLFGRASKTLRHFVLATATALILLGLVQLVFLPFDTFPSQNMTVGLWLSWLPFAILALLAQTGAEEVMFRGYIQSQLGARFRSPSVWLVLPSILFAALHYAPGMSTTLTVYILIGTFLFGLMAADLTARTGSLGAAWGFHFANNTLAITLISYDSTFSGLNLFEAATTLDTITGFSPIFLLDAFAITAVWLAIRRVLAV